MDRIPVPIIKHFRADLNHYLERWPRDGGLAEKRRVFLEALAPYSIRVAYSHREYNPFRWNGKVAVNPDVHAMYGSLHEIPFKVELNAAVARILLGLENHLTMDQVLYELQARDHLQFDPYTIQHTTEGNGHANVKSLLL